MNKAFMLQSGFLAWPTSDLVKTDPTDPNFKADLYSPDYQVMDTENYYDKGVEALFTQWRKDNSCLDHFEFREAIILTTYRVFREKTISPWLRLQLSRASLSYLHRKFLTESLGSAVRNVAKTVDNFQYYRLLRPTVSAVTTPSQDRDVTGVLSTLLNPGDNTMMSDIVFKWTMDIDGLADLLSTLHVIFGRRSGSASVSERLAT